MRVSPRFFIQAAVMAVVPLLLPPQARADDKKSTFDDQASISAWTVKGDVAIDAAKNREGAGGGALKVGPGGKALWKLADDKLSGTVELWVYDDGTSPEN